MTKLRSGDFSQDEYICSRYALNKSELLFEEIVCNQKLIALLITEITKGICPSSLYTAKLVVLEFTPRTDLQNLVLILSNSVLPLNDISNISLSVFL